MRTPEEMDSKFDELESKIGKYNSENYDDEYVRLTNQRDALREIILNKYNEEQIRRGIKQLEGDLEEDYCDCDSEIDFRDSQAEYLVIYKWVLGE